MPWHHNDLAALARISLSLPSCFTWEAMAPQTQAYAINYHQCVKGRFNGKPIRIPANSTPFDVFEAHYFEAIFYDELIPSGEDSTLRPVGIPLPS